MSTIAEAAKHIDLSERRFHELINAGVISRRNRSQYDLDVVRVAYIRNLREGSANRGDPELAAARRRKALAEAESAELDLLHRQGTLVTVEGVEKRWNKIGANIKTKLFALPSRLAPVLVGKKPKQIEAIVRDEIEQVLFQLSGTKPPSRKRPGG